MERLRHPRALLIFDIWNPYLSDDERALVRAAIETVGAYYHGRGARRVASLIRALALAAAAVTAY